MAVLPLDEAIPRFRVNEDRVDAFVNGGLTSTFLTSTGATVPSIRKFLNDKNTEINLAVDGLLALATGQAERAEATGFRFLTPKAADPTTRDDGSPLQNGDIYFNTTSGLPRIRSGGAWVSGSYSDTQGSVTDTTAGRVLAQGAFGLGLDGYAVTDANSATLNGFWTGSSISNFPSTGFVVGFSAFRAAGASGVQIAMVLGTNGRLYRRHRVSGTWNAWQELVSGVIGSTDGRNGQNVIPLGTDPSEWPAGFSGLQTADGSLISSAGTMFLLDNLWNDGTNWRYVGASNGAILSVSGASMLYRNAPTGVAGNVATLSDLFSVSSSLGVRSGRDGVMLPHDGFAARVNFNGTGTVAVRASKNVSSVVDGGTGTYTINFTTAMPNDTYSVFGTAGNTAATGAVRLAASVLSSASACTIEVVNTSGALLDATTVNVGIVP